MKTNNWYISLNEEQQHFVSSLISSMTIEEKIGQFIVPFAFGNFYNESSPEFQRIVSLIENQKVGGFCIFKGNIYNYAHLIKKMQAITNTPLLISADFERGLGMRISDAISFPYNMGVAATKDSSYAYKMAVAISQEMKALGIHQNYAPVADINTHPNNPIVNVRAYSEDPETVIEYCKEFIRGCNEEKILSTAKHFPGHGNTDIDSHTDLSTMYSSEEEFFNVDLLPFKKAIEFGVSSIMVAHLSFPFVNKDEKCPTTVSPYFVNHLIREILNFNGLVVTDALTMYGITNFYSVGEATVKSFLAGNDMILLPADEEIAYNSLLLAAEKGLISENRINESLQRIMTAKMWSGVFTPHLHNLTELSLQVNRPETLNLAKEIAYNSITVVKNESNLLPLDSSKKISCLTISDVVATELELIFQNKLNNNITVFKKYILDPKSTDLDYAIADTIIDNSDIVIVPVFIRIRAFQGGIVFIPEQIDLIKRLIEQNNNYILISFGNPYLYKDFEGISFYINAFGDSDIVQTETVNFLLSQN